MGYEHSHKPEPYAPKQGTCSCLSRLCTHTCCRTSRNLGQRYTGHSSRALSSNPHLHGSGFYGVNYERAITCRRPTHAKRRPPTFYYIVHSPPPLPVIWRTCLGTNLDPFFPFVFRELQEAEAPVWLSRSQFYAPVHSRGLGELYRKAEAVIGQGTEHKSVGSSFAPLPVTEDPAPYQVGKSGQSQSFNTQHA